MTDFPKLRTFEVAIISPLLGNKYPNSWETINEPINGAYVFTTSESAAAQVRRRTGQHIPHHTHTTMTRPPADLSKKSVVTTHKLMMLVLFCSYLMKTSR